ncbi:uroporphyrinogen-III synthase [Nosocomiicoccus ampullae]|uniref:uroporphyrinogen-III synthase n=1 Tax=Nosocomiicoccus ampullae TaxID=489910 RepID=UPI00214F1269|nr:uroporphyrinogen-III synthase [Nosocomiicoccus ampullae]
MKSTKISKVIVTQSHFRDVNTSLELLHLPIITFKKLEFNREKLNKDYDWVVITSKNTVKFFYNELKTLNAKHIASIGKTTTEALKDAGFHVDFEPSGYTQEGFKEEFDVQRDIRVLYPASKDKRSIMRDYFIEKGADLTEIALYQPAPNMESINQLKKELKNIDGLTFSSPSGVHAFMEHFKKEDLEHIKVVSIGHVTQKALMSYGIQTQVPKEATLESMITLIEEEFQNEI